MLAQLGRSATSRCHLNVIGTSLNVTVHMLGCTLE